jgi:limonene 1,2-monooxygenase
MGQDQAEQCGQALRREEWRLVIRVHLADTKEEAVRDVR